MEECYEKLKNGYDESVDLSDDGFLYSRNSSFGDSPKRTNAQYISPEHRIPPQTLQSQNWCFESTRDQFYPYPSSDTLLEGQLPYPYPPPMATSIEQRKHLGADNFGKVVVRLTALSDLFYLSSRSSV